MPDFDHEWARCAPWIEAALEHAADAYELDDVKALVVAREARFWAGRNAAMITTVLDEPRAKTFNFWLAGGDLDELRDELRPMAEAYARELGCDRATIAGRAGWARALGYRPLCYICTKDLRT